uniref:Uncharacterized protein n=1 Tax=Cacopsylla melanoneura TaxID=428564 RepID=A0A8D8Z9F1_9HEMI
MATLHAVPKLRKLVYNVFAYLHIITCFICANGRFKISNCLFPLIPQFHIPYIHYSTTCAGHHFLALFWRCQRSGILTVLSLALRSGKSKTPLVKDTVKNLKTECGTTYHIIQQHVEYV